MYINYFLFHILLASGDTNENYIPAGQLVIVINYDLCYIEY